MLVRASAFPTGETGAPVQVPPPPAQSAVLRHVPLGQSALLSHRAPGLVAPVEHSCRHGKPAFVPPTHRWNPSTWCVKNEQFSIVTSLLACPAPASPASV